MLLLHPFFWSCIYLLVGGLDYLERERLSFQLDLIKRPEVSELSRMDTRATRMEERRRLLHQEEEEEDWVFGPLVDRLCLCCTAFGLFVVGYWGLVLTFKLHRDASVFS